MEHLTDAPAANILILAGVIFLAVAILGQIDGLLGKLFGPAKADLQSRALAGLLGVALVTGGVKLHLLTDTVEDQAGHSADQARAVNCAAVAQAAKPADK